MEAKQITELSREDMAKMTKAQLIDNLAEAIAILNSRKEQRSNKKFVVLELLQEKGAMTILDIANALDISTKNVSSLLCYLRKDGHKIHIDELGRRYLI